MLTSSTDINANTNFTLSATVLAADLTAVAAASALTVTVLNYDAPASVTTLTGDFGKKLDVDGFTYLLDGFGNYLSDTNVALAPRPDIIQGRPTANNISGGGGNDGLWGGAGDDVIDGGLGDDLIAGGLGRDTLNGGAGNDWIVGSANAGFARPTRTDDPPPTIDFGKYTLDGITGFQSTDFVTDAGNDIADGASTIAEWRSVSTYMLAGSQGNVVRAGRER